MPNYPHIKDLLGFLSIARAIVPTFLTAGGAGDATAVYSATFDKTAQPQSFENAVVNVQARAVLAAGKNLAVAVAIQETDAADFNDGDLVTTTALGTLTLSSVGGGTVTDEVNYAIDESARKTRWRLRVTPNLSADNTDTAQVMATLVRNGARYLPV